MQKGKIKSIERASGYGFITSDEGVQVFFHQRWLRNVKFSELKEGDEVVFEVNQGPRGLRAHRMTLAGAEKKPDKIRPVDRLFKD